MPEQIVCTIRARDRQGNECVICREPVEYEDVVHIWTDDVLSHRDCGTYRGT